MDKLAELYFRNRERFVKFGHTVEPYVLITVFVFFGIFVGQAYEQSNSREAAIEQDAAHIREIHRIGDVWRSAYMAQGKQVGKAAEATALAAERVEVIADSVADASDKAALAAKSAKAAASAANRVPEVSRKEINTAVRKANEASK